MHISALFCFTQHHHQIELINVM